MSSEYEYPPHKLPYSKHAARLFAAMQTSGEGVLGQAEFQRLTWLCFSGRGEDGIDKVPVHKVVLAHGDPGAIAASCGLISTTERFMFPSVAELTCLQALEIKARSLVMGDLIHFFGELTTGGLLTVPASGVLCTVTNPYYQVLINYVHAAEKFDKGLRVLATIPPVWRDSPIENYAIKCKVMGDQVEMGISVMDDPWVPLFDVAGADITLAE